MLRLYYTSHLDHGATQADIDHILRVSRKNNTADEITGMLILHQGKVLQFLEGPEDKVNGCLDRIRKDPRHRVSDFVSRARVTNRVFPRWSMGLKTFDELPRDIAHAVGELYEITDRIDRANFVDLQPEEDHITRLMRLFKAHYLSEELGLAS